MDNKNTVLLISAFIALIIGISLIAVVASQGNEVTEKEIVVDESFNLTSLECITEYQVNTSSPNCNLTVTNAPTGWKTTGCPIASVVVSNGSGTAWTLTTDYTVTDSSGKINLKNTATTNASDDRIVEVDYNYCGDNYLTESWSRSVLDLIPGFFAIALMLIAVGLFYAVLKNEGLVNI
jgi:hypothetical protein